MPPLRCPHCQASLDDPVVFCGACGRRVAAWQPPGDALPGNGVPARIVAAGGRGDDPNATLPIASDRLPTKAESGAVVEALDDPSASMERVLRPAGPRLVKRAALMLAIGLVAAGITAMALKWTSAPPPRPPVVVNLDAPVFRYDLPSAEHPTRSIRSRRRRSPVASSSGVASPRAPKKGEVPVGAGEGGAEAAPPAESPSADRDRPSPLENAPEGKDPPVARREPGVATAKDGREPGPIEMPGAPDDESLPPSPEELREEERAGAVADGIRFVLRAHRAQVAACYERAFKDEIRSPGGRVTVEFTIDAGGKARRIHTADNSTGKEMLSKCLEQRIAEWEFPKPPDGEFATSYPFVFSGGA